jgi:hypothetical protein
VISLGESLSTSKIDTSFIWMLRIFVRTATTLLHRMRKECFKDERIKNINKQNRKTNTETRVFNDPPC